MRSEDPGATFSSAEKKDHFSMRPYDGDPLAPTAPKLHLAQRLRALFCFLPFITTILFLFPSVAAPQGAPCHLITPGSALGQGYGYPYDVLSSSQNLFIKTICNGSTIRAGLGSGDRLQYIYHIGYEWTGSSWRQIQFTGRAQVSQEWYVGSAESHLPRTAADLQDLNYIVAFICTWHQGAWKCGCRDRACATPYWQLQVFRSDGSTPDQDGIAGTDEIPDGACWYYDSTEVSAADRNSWNSAATAHYHSRPGGDLDVCDQNRDAKIWTSGSHQACRVLPNGVINCPKVENDSNWHTMLMPHPEECSNTLGRGLHERRTHRFGYDMCIPESMSTWADQGGWIIVNQMLLTVQSAGGPWWSMTLRANDGNPEISWCVKGDSRNALTFRGADNPPWQFIDRGKLPGELSDFYSFTVEFVGDPSGQQAMVTVWANRQQVYNIGPVKTGANTDVADPFQMPSFGVYTYEYSLDRTDATVDLYFGRLALAIDMHDS